VTNLQIGNCLHQHSVIDSDSHITYLGSLDCVRGYSIFVM